MKRPRPTETHLQCFAAEWLERIKPNAGWFHVPNGGLRSKKTAAILKAMGAKAGVPDLVFWGMKHCPLAFVELKRGDGRLSPEQIDFEAEAALRLVPYYVIKTDEPMILVAQLEGLLRAWGAIGDINITGGTKYDDGLRYLDTGLHCRRMP